MIRSSFGNMEFLELPKTAFLCSRKVSANTVLKCYDWAIAQREANRCIISGFHSQIEKDVLHYLLKGAQPIILALARGLKVRIEPELKQPLEQGRLLIISPFESSVKRVTAQTANIRNRMMIEMADEVVIGHASSNGQLEAIINNCKEKEIKRL